MEEKSYDGFTWLASWHDHALLLHSGQELRLRPGAVYPDHQARYVAAGCEAAEEYGLAIGDYVMIDRLATFAHTAPIAALKYNSVICKTNKDQTDYFPLKGMLFVEPDEKDDVSVVGGIAVQNYAEKLRTGTITKQNCPDVELPFKEGDKVLLSKGADRVEINDKTLHIYKYDMVVATIKD